MTSLKRTPLYAHHVAAGAKMVDFGGFEMPVRYTGDKLEHLAVRSGVGLFDVSHMGEVFLEGPGALRAVRRLFTNDASAIVDGQAMYAGLLNERGTFIDDCVVYRFSSTKFLVVVNASNREKDWQWIHSVVTREFAGDVVCRDDSDAWGQLAVQGPRAVELVASLCGEHVREVGGYHFTSGDVGGTAGCIIARTGYTGEDGFELYVPAAQTGRVWEALVTAGERYGLALCGLACRDTLRLEAGMALYGNDIDEEHTPLEAGLGWIVKFSDDREFIGAAALLAQRAEGVARRLRGIEMVGRGIPRHGYRVLSAQGEPIGVVTSGTHAPHLDRPVAMAYIQTPEAELGNVIAIEIRDRPIEAKVARLPFYRRSKP
ncbi:MAG: glycine cleavage system aminomethyltransferase GcvT [Myxococcota bacterium]